MTYDEVLDKLCLAVTAQTGFEVSSDWTLGDAGSDDLDVIEIVIDLEEQLEVEIDEDKFKTDLTMEDLATYLHGLLGH